MPQKIPTVFTVLKAWHLTPHMIRVTLTAPEIAQINPDCHGANCKLYLPEPGQIREDFSTQLANGPRPTVRTYTVRQMRQPTAEIDIDFVDHGDAGPASAWARAAEPGSFCGFAGPGPIKIQTFYADRYLLVADMSALPVALATLEAMPHDAQGLAIFEVLSDADRQNIRIPPGIECNWIVNAHPGQANEQIIEQIDALNWGPDVIQTCIAGESSLIKKLRKTLLIEQKLPRSDCYISGYWKIGLIEDEHQAMKRKDSA